MKFPHAAKGVSKIFSAEIISLVAGVILAVVGVFTAVLLANQDSSNEETIGLVWVILGLAGAALLAVGGIIKIVGYFQAAKDEEGFKRAILCTVFSFIFMFVAEFFIGKSGFQGWIGAMLSTMSQILDMLVAIFMIIGIMHLAVECHRADVVKNGSTILRILLILYFLSFMITFLTRAGAEGAFSATIVKWLSVISLVLCIFLYVFQLVYLGKAKKMLSEN